MPKTIPIFPKEYRGLPEITFDTGFFDFSPEEEEDPKLVRLRELPKEDIPKRLEWALKKRPFLTPGRKFDVEEHKYLIDLYECEAKEIIAKKSGQAGVSEWLLTYAMHACDQRNANVLYVFPSEATMSDFSTARLGPAIEASDYLKSIVIDGSGKGGFYGSDKTSLKRFRERFFYLRGSKVDTEGNAAKLKSVDADILILDELDEQDQRAAAIAKKRLGHAPEHLGNILWVSTPTFPDYGIDAEYEDSDKRQWFIPCQFCGEKQPLSIDNIVIDWDELGRPIAWHGQKENDAWLVCAKCGKKLNRLADGEWVAERPEHERVGFHLTKLFSARNKIIDIVKNLDTVDETQKREAWNQDLGVTYTTKGSNLTAEEIDACRREYGHGPDLYTSCYMGIDVGSVLHVVVRTTANFISKETKQIYAGEASWDSIHNLIKIYHPRVVVVDALPETTQSRKLQDMYPRNMVWIAYYPNQPVGSKRDEIAIWNPVERTVMIDRTRSLDAMFAGFYGRTSTLPANARNIKDYYDHMRASTRVIKEVGTSGVEVATYIDKRKADHFCLVAGTLIETDKGSIPVENIKLGMLVLTRSGYRPVERAWQTSKSSSFVRYSFSDGAVLEATPDHPIFIRGKGFIPLGEMKEGDRVVSYQDILVLERTAFLDKEDIIYFVGSKPIGKAAVYNLTVSEQHEYFANGILVSNCHAENYSFIASLCRLGQGWSEGAGSD